MPFLFSIFTGKLQRACGIILRKSGCTEIPRRFPMPSLRKSRPRRVRKSSRLFDPKAFLAQAGIGRAVHRYSPKQAIFSQGQPADAVFYIQEGKVRLSVVSKQGKEATIALLGPGDFLGEGCIASDQPLRLGSATAMTHCSVLQIEKGGMKRPPRSERRFSGLMFSSR